MFAIPKGYSTLIARHQATGAELPGMADVANIRVADLLLDEENPRLSQPNAGQRETLRAIAADEPRKIYKLADDIFENGVSPADLFIVVATKGAVPRYTVLEGNRRLCALKALESPDTLSGAVPSNILTALKKISARYLESPIDSVRCAVFKSRADAAHWLLLRHTGENEGAGIVPWGSDETARFVGQVRGTTEPYRQALDFAERSGQITRQDRENLNGTTFKRLIETPVVREKLGVTIKKRQLLVTGDAARAAKAIAWVVQDLINRNVSVGEVYDLKKRQKYARIIPATVVVKGSGPGTPASSAASRASSVGKPKEKKQRRRPIRDHLIPNDCVMSIQDQRIQDIERELRKLSLQEYPNAVGVLFRVFTELSTDWYINDQALSMPADPKLAHKLKSVGDDLLKRRKLNAQQVRPVRQAATSGSYLGPTITLMNNYVHNAAMHPAPGDLRSHWNSLQPFFSAIWSP